MSTETALSKRIKRHVVGRKRNYFASVTTGFERVCSKELSSLPLSAHETVATNGGVEFSGHLQDCYLANLHLRTAGRILLRITAFTSTNFRQLEKKITTIPWELYLDARSRPQIHVTTRHCRIYHTAAIANRFSEAIAKHLQIPAADDRSDPADPSFQRIFVRGVDDRFTVSIDSSGAHLYKRGLKKHPGTAPLRETMAAASLMLAGYDPHQPLVDPMCGTGTFPLEAALMAKNIPPGWYRDFAFTGWPSYRKKRFEHLRRQAENNFVSVAKPLIFASDLDSQACRRLQRCTQRHGLADALTVAKRDFFELTSRDFSNTPGLIAINPPYGQRMGTRLQGARLFNAVCRKLTADFRGWTLVLIAAEKKAADAAPFSLQRHRFTHGGLKLYLLTGTIS